MSKVSLINGHIDGSETCVICGRDIPEGSQVCVICGKVPSKVQTNYDRIRNMSVEEMAEALYSIKGYSICVLPTSCLDKECNVCIKKWLESEVDTE